MRQYLGDATGTEREALLAELLRLDVHYRRRLGESPALEDYQELWPGDTALIARVLQDAPASVSVAGPGATTPHVGGGSSGSTAPGLSSSRDPDCGAFGRYAVRRRLGAGGFGTVYLGWDAELQRPVAIKVPRPDRFGSEEERDRFLEEARTVARLVHPGIVPVFDVGRHTDGTLFIVMEYVEGSTLEQRIASGRPPPAEAAELVARIAEAVHFAHRHGFVHRDLKPANVLLDAEGRPRIVDFGLAVHESQQRRRAGERSGTGHYMAPEQVRGEVHRMDGRADIWALGVMLYELLTGRRPFVGDDLESLFDEIARRDPKPPRQIDDRIPQSLERICLKCLAKLAADRYTTAKDLARSLRHWQRPVRRRTAMLAIGAPSIALVCWGAWLLSPRERDNGSGPVPAATTSLGPLEGTVDLLVWSPSDRSRRGLRLNDPRALPLRAGDQVRLEAHLNRPAYLYLVWIDSEGKAEPLYPWTPGQWDDAGPAPPAPAQRLALPKPADEGWTIQAGAPGMETVVLLARESPWNGAAGLRPLLADLPRQPMQTSKSVAWFVRGELLSEAEDALRAPSFYGQRIDDPVLKTQRIIAERLGAHFSLIRSVSFANRAE